jgi:SAM-dependent methyltransferase
VVGIGLDIAKNTVRAVRPIRARRDRRAIDQGYDEDKNSVAYTRSVFDKHAGQARRVREIGGNVLELGPGGNVGVALLFLAAGAKSATCIDVLPWSQTDLPLYRQLVDDPAPYFERIDYRVPEAIETTRLPDESFDIVHSHACLEHVWDPVVAVRQIARLLRPGGVTSHQIDLRDHRDFDRPLDFLRYSDWVWRSAQSRRIYTNRWRRSDWVNAFQSAGLRILTAESTLTGDCSEATRAGFHPRFRAKSLDDLRSLGILISAVKPESPSGRLPPAP